VQREPFSISSPKTQLPSTMKIIAVLLLASLSLTASFVNQPVGSRVTTDLAAMKKKKEKGNAFNGKVCVLTTHELDIFLNTEYVVSLHVVL
jgi:hypothetical protein